MDNDKKDIIEITIVEYNGELWIYFASKMPEDVPKDKWVNLGVPLMNLLPILHRIETSEKKKNKKRKKRGSMYV